MVAPFGIYFVINISVFNGSKHVYFFDFARSDKDEGCSAAQQAGKGDS